jgi:UDP-hydrolysing UDP-N-acetyl-D-glucosamine 2-epimerase
MKKQRNGKNDNKKIIAFFTTSRAEFGALAYLIRECEKSSVLDYLLFAGGMHLAREFGYTISEIRKSGLKITATFDSLLNGDDESSLIRSDGVLLFEMADIFSTHHFDAICISGDRHELLSIVTAAILYNKPIIHLHGGEITEGVIDEQVRHMITKAAHLHFTTCKEYAQNIIQMGEESWRVHNTGFLAADHMIKSKSVPRNKLFRILNLDPGKRTILLTYHPVSKGISLSPIRQISNVFSVLEKFNIQVVITSPGHEKEWDSIKEIIQEKVISNKGYHYFDSLGIDLYHSLVPACACVVGNSSSGITEVPYHKIPTVNIGDRQKGRIRHKSVIDTGHSISSICRGLELAFQDKFVKSIQDMEYKFGNGKAAENMVKILAETIFDGNLIRKRFNNFL